MRSQSKRIQGKSFPEVEEALRDYDRDQLVRLIFTLATFESLVTSAQIAEACRIDVREVRAAMREGRFVDPIHGPGFFLFASNSHKVTTSAANAWRGERFASRDSIPARKTMRGRREIDLGMKNGAQRATADRPAGAELEARNQESPC